MMDYFTREKKSYCGSLMAKGKLGEQNVLEWLENNPYVKDVIDMREYRISQRLDVDCGIETLDGALVLAEIKTDKYLGITNNFLFEIFRINHFTKPDKIFYLGWAFRSPAKYLLYYSPHENAIYRFLFSDIRQIIGKYTANIKPTLQITPTDNQKTTFNLLIPQCFFNDKVKKFDFQSKGRKN